MRWRANVSGGRQRAHVVWFWGLFFVGFVALAEDPRCHPGACGAEGQHAGCGSWGGQCIEQVNACLRADRYVQECAPVPAGEWRMAAHNKPPFEETRESLEKAKNLKSTAHGDFI
jgi:hypothetical protein